MIRSIFFAAAMMASSFTAQATEPYIVGEDTPDFRQFFEGRFVGLESSASKEWDYRECSIFGCAGKKVYGSTDGRVTGVQSFSGRGVRITERDGGWDGHIYNEALIDVQYVFDYQGSSEGKAQCYPGNYFCGMEWGKLHPGGVIHVDIMASPGTNFSIHVWYEVYPGHSDRPNRVLKDAMAKLSANALSILERWGLANDIEAEVILR